MAEFEKGDIFIDYRAVNIAGEKAKYFLCMNDANEADDKVVCFVMNTEGRMDKYHVGCNNSVGKFVLILGDTPLENTKGKSFLKNPTSLMLSKPRIYTVSEFLERSDIKFIGKIIDDKFLRRIKNCIDFNDLTFLEMRLIKEAFKILK